MTVRRAVSLIALASALAYGCSGGSDTRPAATAPAPPPQKVEAKGLHNVIRLSERLFSGGSPDGDEGFASLRELGVETIISVDGARPDVERAHRFGLRYVHLPIGYDSVPEDQGLRIAKAVRDLPGPVYVHCHHGKHRGPAAAAVARLCTDDRCGAEEALEGMRLAGTDPHYTGLYAAPREFRRPTADELDRLPADFPEVAEVTGLAQLMVEVDDRWERLKLARAEGWKAPQDHPDIDPPHEALQVVEQYREALRLPKTAERPDDFRRRLEEARDTAEGLESALRPGEGKAVDREAAEAAFKTAGDACTRCHGTYRDVPRRR
jgi:protein tyrosine phosphatase (PTP) superfamily phosphohydrolase (DUF442 family)